MLDGLLVRLKCYGLRSFFSSIILSPELMISEVLISHMTWNVNGFFLLSRFICRHSHYPIAMSGMYLMYPRVGSFAQGFWPEGDVANENLTGI